MQGGDHHTRYFHSRATHRKRRNSIRALRLDTGELIADNKHIGDKFLQYYHDLFTASLAINMGEALDGISPSVTTEMNSTLLRPFTSVEVKDALNQMAPLKALVSNGFSPIFYQSYWHVVGQDVIEAVLSCLNSSTLLSSINHTFVTLIPKVKNPKKVIEYRPISLCNVVYKLILKVLANSLKLVLPHVISNTQSAFVPGHLITDNISVAFETLHHMHNQRGGRTGSMALKLDMSKAYNKVEWSFLQQVMIRMGFDPKWVSLIMECVSTVSYSLFINGEPTGYIISTRGLRQGDPISP